MHPSSDLLKPLPLCDAMEIHPKIQEDSTLFRLPDDILALIVEDLIDSGVDFKPLALLSPSFRQLARTVLFRVVTVDWRPNCYNGILAFLNAEAFERLQNRRIQGQTQTPSLGACVRKVVVNPWDARHAMRCNWERIYEEPELGETVAHFEAYYDPVIHQVISSLPNLEFSDLWEVTISQSLLNSLVGSTVRNVELCARMSAICPRIRVSWPITSLVLHLLENDDVDETLSRSLYCESILRLCAPTLQQLTISGTPPRSERRPLSFNLSFPDLIFLDIHRADFDQPALKSLLLTSKKLHHLEVNCTPPSVREVMNTPGELVALRILVLHWLIPLDREKSDPSNQVLFNPQRIQVLEASCRWLTHLTLAPLGRHIHRCPKILKRKAEQYGRQFPYLESIRLWRALFVREDRHKAFSVGV